MKRRLIMVFISTLLFTGCASEKIEILPADRQVYQSDYQLAADEQIILTDLQTELEKVGVKLEEREDNADENAPDYHFSRTGIWIHIYTKEENKGQPGELIEKIQLGVYNDIQILTHPLFASLFEAMDDEKIDPWLGDLEDQYKEIREREFSDDRYEVMGSMLAGRANISFIGYPLPAYKTLEFTWANIEDIPKEFEAVVAELEHQGLFMTDYTQGYKGNQISVRNPNYHTVVSADYGLKIKEEAKLKDAAAYKIMYDPNANQHYSAQLYGIIPGYPDDLIKIEDMVGIDTISRVMEMTWEDFQSLTKRLNEELEGANELEGVEYSRKYNTEGQVAGYNYEISSSIYGQFCRFTVLLEKI